MPHPAVNTKVEKLTEAFEDMAISVAQGVMDDDALHAAENHERVMETRRAVSEALHEFLRPILRVASEQ